MTTLALNSASRISSHRAQHPQPVTAMRLTNRGRRVLAVFFAIVLLAALFLVSALFAGQAGASEHGGVADFEYLTVGHGDTLWSLAVEVAPTADPREVIADFKRVNALSSSSVLPGQQLAIPAAYASNR